MNPLNIRRTEDPTLQCGNAFTKENSGKTRSNTDPKCDEPKLDLTGAVSRGSGGSHHAACALPDEVTHAGFATALMYRHQASATQQSAGRATRLVCNFVPRKHSG
jgi:hypothetical protein